nr:6-hexanolactone hydrolase [Kibdelosporangium sp. MJ126-NF4]
MSALGTDVVKAHFEHLGREMHPDMSLDAWRDVVERYGDVTAEPGGVDYDEVELRGLAAMWATPKQAHDRGVILCFHGGGFATCSMYTHRKLFGHLAKATGFRALILDYRRSPEHRHPAQVEDAVSAYAWVLEQGYAPEWTTLAGDSAGGGLCVTAMLRARERGLPLPAAAMLLSPWVDMERTSASLEYNRERDVLLGDPEIGQTLIGMLLGESGDPRDPSVNPLYADLAGLSPLYVQAGSDEAIVDDARRLAQRARDAGVDTRLDVFDGQQHTFQLGAGRSPTADEALGRLASWALAKVGSPPLAEVEDGAP